MLLDTGNYDNNFTTVFLAACRYMHNLEPSIAKALKSIKDRDIFGKQ